MAVLNRTTRRQLQDLLESAPVFDTHLGRDLLLRDLPGKLVGKIVRSEAKIEDLDQIIHTCDLWWPGDAPAEAYPIRVLIENAQDVLTGSEQAEHLRQLLTTLPATIGSGSPYLASPYPGMMPFSADDARFFYGRELEIQDILQRLRYHQFLLIIGSSGSGKSSLVFAGVLPHLTDSGFWLPDSWQVITMRPGTNPTDTLSALLPSQPGTARLLVVIDQFEEIFTQSDRHEQSRFLSALTALRTRPACTVLLTLRADFYPDLMSSVLWPPGEGERLEITPLQGDALYQAIVEPAADVGVEVEADLAQKLLADAAGEPGRLPLLQETLLLLWGQMRGRTLSLTAYEALGQGGRSGLVVALATWADATLNKLEVDERTIARRIFLRLIQFGEGRPDTRRTLPVRALQAANDQLAVFSRTLDGLTTHRLLTATGAATPGSDKIIDIAHEALIQGWPRLQGWLTERRAAELIRRRLEDKAVEWDRRGRGLRGLLDESDLQEATVWIAGADAADLGYSADVLALVTRSREVLEKEAQAIEEQRLHELAQAQALAEERAAANRRLRQRAFGLALLAVLTACIALLAGVQWQAATQAEATAVAAKATAVVEGQISRARAIAANALTEMDRDPELGLLLAMEAVSSTRGLTPSFVVPQAELALHETLLGSSVRRVLSGTGGSSVAAYNPDGQRLVIATSGTIQVWDPQSGQPGPAAEPVPAELRSVTYSPDGHWIVAGSSSGQLWWWEPGTGRTPESLAAHQDAVVSIAYSLDGQQFVTASRDATFRVCDSLTRKTCVTHQDTAPLNSAVFSPDGRFILTAADSSLVKIWDAQSGKVVRVLTHTSVLMDNLIVNSAAYSPDNTHIVTAGNDRLVRIWDAQTESPSLDLAGHTGFVFSAAYSPDSAYIVSAGGDHTARIWNAATGLMERVLMGDPNSILQAAYRPDGRTIYTVNAEGTIRIWSATIEELPTLIGHRGQVSGAVYSPDGSAIATAGEDGTARIWTRAGQLVMTFTGHLSPVNSLAYSPNGKTVVTADDAGTARIWDIQTGRVTQTLTGYIDAINYVVYSHDGSAIATAGTDAADADSVVKIWSPATGELLHTLAGQQGSVQALAYNKDDRTLVTGGSDGRVIFWDTQSWQETRVLTDQLVFIASAAYSPDGRYLLIAGSDDNEVGRAVIWDNGTGTVVRRLLGASGPLTSGVFSPDGHRILTTSLDGTAQLWNADTGEEYLRLPGLPTSIVAGSYNPQGDRVLIACADGTARQYLIEADGLLALAGSRVRRTLTAAERVTYLWEPATGQPGVATPPVPISP